MRVLGLDLSLTSTGYCMLDEDLVVWSGTVAPRSREVIRIAEVAMWLDAQLDDQRPTHVALEGYSYGSPQGHTHAFAIGELGGVVKLVLWRAEITTLVIPPATWKKQLLGKGNLRKDQVRLEVFKRYGIEFNSQDTLDAWCVAMCARRQLLGMTQPAKVSARKAAHISATEGAVDQADQKARRRPARAAATATTSSD